MNLEEALAKEAELRPKILSAIASQHTLDEKSVAKVDACMLGNWLHGEGERKFPFVKSFAPAVEAHDAFHAEVEKVARQVNLGEYEQAQAMLGSGTPCTKAFIAMVAAVRQLKTDAKL
ncbi:MAG TPA: CZB domain-containing protein [Noviherbaspirillum sp.]|nr:CZB domain-containing protein [Noviherbaspirillum sp.]